MELIGIFMILGLLLGGLLIGGREKTLEYRKPIREIRREMEGKHAIIYQQQDYTERIAWYASWVMITGVIIFSILFMTTPDYNQTPQIAVAVPMGVFVFVFSTFCFDKGFSWEVVLIISFECIWYTNNHTQFNPGIIAWAEIRSLEIFRTPPCSLTPEGEIASLLEKGPYWNNLLIHTTLDETLVVPGIGGDLHKLRKTLQTYAPTVPITIRNTQEEEED